MSLKGGGVGLNVMTGLDPDAPQRGPYEASEGIYPGRRQGKTGGGHVFLGDKGRDIE